MVINRLRCVPPYWSYLQRSLTISVEKLGLCKTFESLHNATKLIKNFEHVSKDYEPPCVEMTSLVTFSREEDQLQNQFRIKVIYPETFYQEIKNVRDFTFETFWSTAGGYLGIFLGYSLLQIPELLHDLRIHENMIFVYFRSIQLPALIGKF